MHSVKSCVLIALDKNYCLLMRLNKLAADNCCLTSFKFALGKVVSVAWLLLFCYRKHAVFRLWVVIQS